MACNVRTGLLLLTTMWLALVAMLPSQEAKPNATIQSDPAALLMEARGLYRKGSFDQAVAKFNEVLKADPGSGESYAGIIRCFLKQDRVRDADDELQKGLQATPENPDFKVAQGELLFRQGEIPEAGTLFSEVMVLVPPNARAYLGAARVAEMSAMYGREYILIKRAREIDPADPDIKKKWMQTQAVPDRIKSLEDYLAQPSNDDADTRRTLTESLELLKASQPAPLGGCRPSSDVPSTETNLVQIQTVGQSSQGFGLEVTINGQASKLLLDTGASGILVSRKLASQAGLKRVSEILVTGIGDKPGTQGHIASANSVRIGNLEFHNCQVEILDNLSAGEDGIIGVDVFSEFLIEIDFPGSRLRLSQLPPRPGEIPSKASLTTGHEESATAPEEKPAAKPDVAQPIARPQTSGYNDRYIAPEMHSYVQTFRMGHMLLVPTKINEGAEKLFLLDTGAFDNTITPDAAQEVTKVHRAPLRKVQGLSGDVKRVYVAHQVTLDFGHLRQTVPDMVSFDMSRVSRYAGTEVSGTLGLVMLKLLKVRLDYRDALADFQYTTPPARR
jgi:tetratricopeptide (TPR) repeat protein